MVVVRIMTVFDHNPGCGLDCASPELEAALLTGLATVLMFPILGALLTRGEKLTARRVVVVSAALMIGFILAATCHYVFQLRAHYVAAEKARPIQPDLDFMYMAIAIRDVQAYAAPEAGQSSAASMIPQWQRCAIGGASCEKRPRQVQMLCKIGVVFVRESDWKNFSLIPQENVFGAIPLKSMNLCAPDNRP
ncbi:hypothetical protein [Ralstonia sp. A12]|uniref:hypothetical protein n=1 Tax=Ralstonia sp. A12 TaxID=1217052 RepID=UPI0006933237|nr:hypothetical protein [Ralstonia sp. A12]